MGFYKYVADAWEQPKEELDDLWRERLVEWRRGDAVERIERPTRIDRARNLGYKAKQGFVVARARVPVGGRKRPKPAGGRRHKKMGRFFTPRKSHQWIAEERAADRFPNLVTLNSYWVAGDSKHKWFEVVMVDPDHPAIQNDPDVNWVTDPSNRNRSGRGLTSAGRRSRGLQSRGKGAERVRPSKRKR